MAERTPLPGGHRPGPLGVSWVDGRLLALGEAAVRADDHAVLVGDGVFETTKVVDGVPFALSRHLRRLGRSARGLGLDEASEGRIRSAVGEVLAADPAAGETGKRPAEGDAEAAPAAKVAKADSLSELPIAEFGNEIGELDFGDGGGASAI